MFFDSNEISRLLSLEVNIEDLLNYDNCHFKRDRFIFN